MIAGRNGNPKRVDRMELCGHYDCWRENFRLVRELGLNYSRRVAPQSKTHLAPDNCDW